MRACAAGACSNERLMRGPACMPGTAAAVLRQTRAAITIDAAARRSPRSSMAASLELPADPSVADLDAMQEDAARWIGAVAALGV